MMNPVNWVRDVLAAVASLVDTVLPVKVGNRTPILVLVCSVGGLLLGSSLAAAIPATVLALVKTVMGLACAATPVTAIAHMARRRR